MRCSKVEVTFLAGIGIFLVGTACLMAVEVHNVYPAREEQKFEEINCTIASGNLDATAKCSHNRRDDTSYPCLRIYVLCGKDSGDNGLLLNEKRKPRLLSKDFYSLDKQVSLMSVLQYRPLLHFCNEIFAFSFLFIMYCRMNLPSSLLFKRF